MKLKQLLVGAAGLLCSFTVHAQLLTQFELEDGALLGSYTNIISEPFAGVAFYSNSDGVTIPSQWSGVPGIFRLDLRGASSNAQSASISVYLDGKRLASPSFTGITPSLASVEFRLETVPEDNELLFLLETDSGSNDTYVDGFELHRQGDIPPPPPPPVLPAQGAYESGLYRNMFAELGYSEAEVQARVAAVYEQLFHSTDEENKAIFIPVGDDMAYIWDTGNNDVRSEGMSYGMMMALQMDRQEDFDRLWKWAHTYSLNREGDMKGYFAWQVTTEGQVRDKNPAPDGEEYFATALFFAAHRWGNGEGIFNYSAEANQILDDMFDNGQTRYANGGILESFGLFNHDQLQIVFSPATPSDRNWTDPSYHLPAFYELWARWADNNNDFWAALAPSSRNFLPTAVHPETGLSPDYAYFDGSPHGDFQNWKDTFQYDAWRTVGNAAMDYYWWKKDDWQINYANTLQAFFKSEGINSYSSLYELNGVPYENNADHSPGLVAMNAMASLAADKAVAWEFVQALWDTPVPTGKYRYYDGCLYMFAMLALSGNYQIYCPPGECDAAPKPTDDRPLAVDDLIVVESGDQTSIDVMENDRPAGAQRISILNFSQGAHGSVTQSGTSLVYVPDVDFVGDDAFSYTITDGTASSTATVTVTVAGPLTSGSSGSSSSSSSSSASSSSSSSSTSSSSGTTGDTGSSGGSLSLSLVLLMTLLAPHWRRARNQTR